MQEQQEHLQYPFLSHEDIARHAYQIWEAAGRPVGDQLAHWFRAEAELRSRAQRNPSHFARIDPDRPV